MKTKFHPYSLRGKTCRDKFLRILVDSYLPINYSEFSSKVIRSPFFNQASLGMTSFQQENSFCPPSLQGEACRDTLLGVLVDGYLTINYSECSSNIMTKSYPFDQSSLDMTSF